VGTANTISPNTIKNSFDSFMNLILNFLLRLSAKIAVKQIQRWRVIADLVEFLHNGINHRFFFHLFINKPLEETLRRVVTFASRQIDQHMD
jgi:hypothetical protein